MREIKFRGYSLEHKMWFYGFLEDWMSAMSPSKPVIHQLSDWNLNSDFEVDNKSVGEFTGLKDKNGKEIYEGDIVKFEHTKEPIVIEDIRDFMRSGINYSEVIGNIYENQDFNLKKVI